MSGNVIGNTFIYTFAVWQQIQMYGGEEEARQGTKETKLLTFKYCTIFELAK